jgi:uncharacterized RDD family membrane protein YckC
LLLGSWLLWFDELTERFQCGALLLRRRSQRQLQYLPPVFLCQPMIHEALPDSPSKKGISDGELVEGLCDKTAKPTEDKPQGSTLIEFPGLVRPVPEWRKQLSHRVREVQERRAREAAEAAAMADAAESVSCALPSAQLELVPDREQPAMNPIVSKALERLDRARRGDLVVPSSTAASLAPAPAPGAPAEPQHAAPRVEATKPRLVVVPASRKTEAPERKPVRVIADGVDDAALSYLESCLSVPEIRIDARDQRPGFTRRVIAAVLDLLLAAFLVAPFAALAAFAAADLLDPRVLALLSGISAVVIFAYLTVSIALTGRTFGMRLLSLRTIDMRTGLIPTGDQSMKRALGYILSLAVFGLGIFYALADSDGRTFHDRFSKTLVVHD